MEAGRQKLSVWGGVAQYLNAGLGAGTLIFPFWVVQAGWIGAAVILLFQIMVQFLSAQYIAQQMMQHPEIRTFGDMGKLSAVLRFPGNARAPDLFAFAFDWFGWIDLFTTAVVYASTVCSSIMTLNTSLSKLSAALITFVLFQIMVIPTLSPVLSSAAGIVSTVVFFMLYFLLIGTSIYMMSEPPGPAANLGEVELFTLVSDTPSFFSAFGGILFMLANQAVLPTIFRDLEDRRYCNTVVVYSFVTLCLCCCVLAVLEIAGAGPSKLADLATQILVGYPVVNWIGQLLFIIKFSLAASLRIRPIAEENARGLYKALTCKPRKVKKHTSGSAATHEAGAKATNGVSMDELRKRHSDTGDAAELSIQDLQQLRTLPNDALEEGRVVLEGDAAAAATACECPPAQRVCKTCSRHTEIALREDEEEQDDESGQGRATAQALVCECEPREMRVCATCSLRIGARTSRRPSRTLKGGSQSERVLQSDKLRKMLHTRETVNSHLQDSHEDSLRTPEEIRGTFLCHIFVGMFAMALTVLLGTAAPNLSVIISINGAVFGVAVCIVMPAASFYYNMAAVPQFKTQRYVAVLIVWIGFGCFLAALYPLFLPSAWTRTHS
jgi:hypothetical protein